ncbi:hypothetical protein D3C87_2022440 [compost metagenome]
MLLAYERDQLHAQAAAFHRVANPQWGAEPFGGLVRGQASGHQAVDCLGGIAPLLQQRGQGRVAVGK